MPTRAIKVWNQSASAWENVGIEAPAGGGSTVSYQTASPSSPTVGQIWVESDVDLTSFDLNQYLTQANASATYIADSIVNAKGDLLTATANDTPAILTAGSNGQMLMADSSATAGLRYVDPPTNRNLFINGAMQVAQRGTSTTGITGDGYFTADRWYFQTNSMGTFTMTVENDAPTGSGLRKSVKLLCTTADASPAAADFIRFRQPLEGQDLQRIKKGTASAEQLTLSFWVKSNVTGTYVAQLSDSDNSRIVGATYTVDASATWEKKTITFPADTTGAFDNDNAASMSLNMWLGAGSNRTSGTLNTTWAAGVTANESVGQTNLAAATNNYWQVTGVQLETGPVATPFEFEPYEATLRKCQRYFFRWGGETSIMVYALGTRDANAAAVTATFLGVRIPVKTTMRVVPSISASSASHWEIYSAGQGAAYALNSFSFDRNDRHIMDFRADTTAASINVTAGQIAALRPTSASGTSYYIDFSAEL